MTPLPAGTYDINAASVPDDGTAFFRGTVRYVVGNALEQFEIRGGSITITRSAGNAVIGTIELRAVRTSPCCDAEPVEIFIAGSFSATAIPVS